ncbi:MULTISPECIES: PLP-dependent transferase [unclassified Enterococcus]|uniref:PLP-dependent transferase n=1 Tax=unclassified Enterococcus TaxID=2608891 RepID=UPI001554F346|nr:MULTISPECIES: PLP-dependent transferase [unclassified Enterococcus]MBS7576681.1 aminotransferase class V-fold PLP-dependent enzyme [Enterococcus sp. MMGLQ5-2]MBS7583832.1 aminotransferase class V-fold PLP-dependent enzyme [Enterococcus sp. MMGLQ5-1]NPD11693.1 aminotransferase class V-fold PLP-dependent enzyme [Enterococcus sp. MMGLQ5-1]NPD36518.1 aminotransferase class V-fold PLP-dependent enzyme [Enterococcus sp. MMGLQ5-2]
MTKDLETILAQIGTRTDKVTGALATPIHFSTTYQHPEFGQSTGFDYTRTQNPTREQLELGLAAIEAGNYAFATSSGMSAIVLATEAFPIGSHFVCVRDLYGGTFRYFNQLEANGLYTFDYATTEAELIELINEKTAVVYLETPTNPLMFEFDIQKISDLAHQFNAKVVVDNTFYTPVYQQPLTLGADVVLHSATKYLSGHNDVLAGAVIVKDELFASELRYSLNTKGAVLSPFDSFLVMRGLKTLALRMKQATENAQAIVRFLQGHSAVKCVLYPGKAGMISFKVKDEQKIPSILNHLKLFTFAESLGGVESLITYPTTQTHLDIPKEVRESYGLTADLLRLSVGIESVTDLISDLKQALEI